MKTERITNLINNHFKHDDFIFDRVKYYLHHDLWPEIVIRPRRNGFEGVVHTQPKLTDDRLSCIREFQKKYIVPLNLPNTTIYFNKDELIKLLV